MRVFRATSLTNLAAFYGVPHVVLSVRGNELWIITDVEYFDRRGLEFLKKMGFVKLPSFESVYFPATSLSKVMSILKILERKYGFEYVVCSKMSNLLVQKIKEYLERDEGSSSLN